MKFLISIFVAIILFSCQQADQKNISNEVVKIEATSDNPCIKCTEKIQTELIACLAKAKTPEEKSACNKKASSDWVAQCKALCNPAIKSDTMQVKGNGACTKCSCPSFREDATDGKCVNIRPPHPNKLCQHTASDHR